MLTADKEERRRRKKAANACDRKTTIRLLIQVKLHYSFDAGRRLLEIRDLPTYVYSFSEQQRAFTYGHRFLRLLRIIPSYADEPGATWLELLIAFEFHGGNVENSINEMAAGDMASYDHQAVARAVQKPYPLRA